MLAEEPELTNVTWKIVRKIATAGIPPKRYAKKAIKMVIGKHGIPNIRRTAGNRNKSGKFMKKVKKLIRKAVKVIKKLNKLTTKTGKYYKKLRKFK